MRALANCPDITIPSGDTVSNSILAKDIYEDSSAILLLGPAALDAATTYKIEVTNDRSATASSTWNTLNDGTNDVSAPAATKAYIYPSPVFQAFRIKSSGAVAADRTWRMTKEFIYGNN